MSKMFNVVLASLALSALVAGCDKKDGAGAPADKSASATGATKAPAANASLKLGKTGLVMDAPGDAEVMDTSGDAPSVSVFRGSFKVGVHTVTPVYAETFEDSVKQAEKDPGCKFTSWKKKESSATGWDIEYACKGFDGQPKVKVEIRKKIGDKSFECGELLENDDAAAKTVAACNTLKKG